MKCLLSLYKKIYNDNKYLLSLYKKTYNDNKYFYYTRRCIIETNISLYKKTYNEIFVSVIQEDV